MARINNLTNFLTDIATAIKSKLGTTDDITASEFDTKINAIETKGTYQNKTVDITENGATNVVPDSGYDALSTVTVNTQVPEKKLQEGTYLFTSNSTVTVEPEVNYDGFSKLNITVNVPETEIKNQDKTITTNGEYTADDGYTGLGTVTVNVDGGSGDIKLFETEEDMQADPSPSDGDLAVVYRDEVSNVQEGSTHSSVTFPSTVVLDETYSGSGNCMIQTSSGEIRLDISTDYAIVMVMTSSTYINIYYESTDGITYTTSSEYADTETDLGENVTFTNMYGDWEDAYGKFMITGGKIFDGLYEYSQNSTEIYNTIKTISIDSTNKKATTTNVLEFLPTLYTIANKMYSLDTNSTDFCERALIVKKDGEYFLYNIRDESIYLESSTNEFIVIGKTNDYTIRKYKLDLDDYIYTYIETVSPNVNVTRSSITYKAYSVSFDNIVAFFVNGKNHLNRGCVYVCESYTYVSGYDITGFKLDDGGIAWHNADNQLSLSDSNQLLPGKVSYGKNGIVTGDKSIYDNLDYSVMWSNSSMWPSDNHFIDGTIDNKYPILTYNHNSNSYGDRLIYKEKLNDFPSIRHESYGNSTTVKISDIEYFSVNKTSYPDYIVAYNYTTVEDNTYTTVTVQDTITANILDVAIDTSNSCVYVLLNDTTNDKLYLRKITADSTMTISTMFSISYTDDYCKGIILVDKSYCYVEGQSAFYKVSFGGAKTIIHNRTITNWSSSPCYSNKYIIVYNGTNSSSTIYNMSTDTWTSIVIPNQSSSALVTINDKTYLFIGATNTMKVIENDVISKTITLPFTISSTAVFSNYRIPLVLNGIVPLDDYVLDTNNDMLYSYNVVSTYRLLYANNCDMCIVGDGYINYYTGIDIVDENLGKYVALYDGNSTRRILPTEHKTIIDNYTLVD